MAFPTGWTQSKPLQIAAVDATLTDFPVLLTAANLPSTMFSGGTPADNGGGDVRFSSDAAGATQLPCEVVSFVTGGSPSAEVWVKVPTVATGGTTIYVWWGNTGQTQPIVSDTYGRNAVWSTRRAVWHLGQDPSGSAPQMVDSTGTNPGTTNGSMTSGQSVAGKAGNGLSFDGTNDYVGCGTNSSLATATKFSLSFAAKFAGAADQLVLTKTQVGSAGWALWVSSGNLRMWWSPDGSVYRYYLDTASIGLDVGNWHHYAFEFDKSGYVSKTPPNGGQKQTHGGSCVAGGKLYAIGGYGGTTGPAGIDPGTNLANPVQSYDPGTDAWTNLSATGFSQRNSCAVAEYAGDIYVFGGTLNGGSATQTCLKYNIAGNSWSNLGNGPAGLIGAGAGIAATLGTKIYVLLDNQMYEYDPASDAWTGKASRTASGINTWSAVVTDGTYIYAIGGFSGAISNVDRYDPVANTWSNNFSTAPYAAWAGVAVYDSTSGNIIYGLGRKTTSTTIEQESRWYKWDRTSGTGGWTQLPSETAPGNAMYAGIISRKVYTFGVRFYGVGEVQDDGQYGGCFNVATEQHETTAAQMKFYKDGVLQRRLGCARTLFSSTAAFEMGNQTALHSSLWLNGTLDEVRFGDGEKGAAWMQAEYQTLFQPSTFVVPVTLLAPADCAHAHGADAVALIQQHVLAMADAMHAQTVDAITLSTAFTLAVADAVHAHAAEALALGQVHVLVVSDAAHAQLVDALTLTLPGATVTLTDRVLIYAARSRALVILPESRVLTLPPEPPLTLQ